MTKIVILLFELISIFPLDYICLSIDNYWNWLRLIRLLKTLRLFEIEPRIKTWFENHHVFNLVRYFFIYINACHFFACILYAIAEYEHKNGGRFDEHCFVFCV